MAKPKRTKTYIGDVVRQPFAMGSKSERKAIVLSTRYGDFPIRREEGHAFFDEELEGLIGKRIRASGIRHRHMFIVQKWAELASQKKKRGKSPGREGCHRPHLQSLFSNRPSPRALVVRHSSYASMIL